MVSSMLLGGTLTTLYFNSAVQDPFNSPKFWLIMMVAGWGLSGLILSLFKTNIGFSRHRTPLILILLFMTTQIVMVFLSENKIKAIVGETQRRNGALSYLALALIMLTMIIYGNIRSIKNLDRYFIFISLIFIVYGLLQINGIDFVTWNNPYNAIILTLGNPNFSGAAMAILTSYSFGKLFMKDLPVLHRFIHLTIVVFLIITIYLSNARQGLLASAVGVLTVLIIVSFAKSRKIGWIFLFTSAALILVAALGMLQKGPLSDLLYKSSVTVRGYYWRAGFEMFRENFWTGIGLDNYGDYFKLFRDEKYPLLYGFETTSTNAHNVFIQFFSTGGIFLGVTYLLIILYILISTVRTLARSVNSRKIEISSVFAAWISFQATSLISIDNIGVSIWGWILGGLLIALNGIQTEDAVKSGASKNSNLESIQPLLGILLIIPILIFISMLYKVESQVYKSRLFASVSQESFAGQSNAQVLSTSQLPLLDSNYQLNLASYLANKGEFTQAISLLTRTIEENPRNQDAYSLLAFIYEQTGEFKLAIGVRNSITKLDPWDANNYLDLGLLHRSLGENDEANTYFNRILDFADKTPVGDEARKFLQE